MKPFAAALVVVAIATAAFSSEAADLLQHHGLANGANCVTVSANDSSARTEPCQAGDSQLFELYANRMLRSNVNGGRCLEYSTSDGSVRAAKCEDGKWEQMWRVRYDDTIIPMGFGISGKCLDGEGAGAGAGSMRALALAPCDATRPSQIFRSSILTPDRGVTLSFDGKCLSSPWSASDPTPSSYACHQDFNQVWSYTADDELRVFGDRCLQHDVATLTTVAIAACDGSSKQKWDVDSTTGRVMPQWSMARCLDLSTSPPTLAYCGSGIPPSAVLDAYGLILAREGRLRRTLMRASSLSNRLECMAASDSAVTLSPCRADAPFWWEFASGMAVKVAGNKCLDFAQSGDRLHMVTASCNQQDSQKWNWDARTGAISSPHPLAHGKCVTYSAGGNSLDSNPQQLTLDACNPFDPKPTQLFRPKPFSQFPPPSRAVAQNAYCSQRSSRAADIGLIRDTLFYHNDMSYLVPSTLTGREASSYYSSVVFDSLSVVLGQQTGALKEGWLVELLQRSTDGVRVLIDLAELMCVVRERDAELQPKITAWFNTNSREPNTRLLEEANFLRMAALQLQLASLPATSVLVRVFSDSVATSVSKRLDSLASVDAVIRYVTSEDMVWFAKLLQPVCSAQPQLKICSPLQWSRLVSARKDLLEVVDAAVNASGKTNELMTPEVNLKADAFVQVYRAGLGKDSPIDAKTWTAFAQYVVFGSSKPVTKYSIAELLRTTTKKEMVLVLALWPFFSSDDMAAWGPYYTALSDQLHDERRRELERIVYRSQVMTLEAYMDGRLSDTALLVTNLLPRICSRFLAQAFRVCGLAKFHTLTSVRAELQRAIKAADGAVTTEIETMAAQFVQVFGANAAAPEEDKLWTLTALRLLFNSVELMIYPPKTLLASARIDGFLLSYVVSVAHFNAINKLINDRDVDGMAAYVHVNSSSSDLAVLGKSVLPRLCFNPNNPEFSVCKLMEFYTGLQQVVTFEKSRFATVVPLAELAEVDVRKQLDVIDQENKHFEVINAIQDSANQIGKKIQEESDKIQDVIKLESAAIRADIDASTKVLFDKMGEEGRALQAAIDASTRDLEQAIGAAADVIRQDIARNTKLLYEKMDDEARALQNSITENTRKLSQQIGAEAATTRSLIKDSTDKLYNKLDAEGKAIRGKIDQATEKLYTKIGEEGRSIRNKIDESTDKLYQKIGDEGVKTRDKIDASTRELTGVINASTSKLEGKIDASTGKIVGTFKTGFTALADYYKSDAKVNVAQLQKNIRMSIETTDKLIKKISDSMKPFTAEMMRAVDLMKGVADAQSVFLALESSAAALEVAAEIANNCNPFKLLFSGFHPEKALQAAAKVEETIGKIQVHDADTKELVRRGKKVGEQTDEMEAIVKEFSSMSKSIAEIGTLIKNLATGDLTPEESSELVDSLLEAYESFDGDVTQTQLTVLQDELNSLIDHILSMIEKVPSAGPIASALQATRNARSQAGAVFAAMGETYSELNAQFEKLGQAARAAANANAANHLGTVASNMGRRRLQGSASSSSFKPFYSMAYAGLSKLFMQYKIQQAAFQFCKFYEYKLGGIAPSMCGNTKFYTPSDIQKMLQELMDSFRSSSKYSQRETDDATQAPDMTDAARLAEPQERVRIEFLGAVEIDARGVVSFVQELDGVPEDGWCEVQSTWSRQPPTSLSQWQTTAQLQCDRRVVDYLCQRFSKPVRYTSRGEVLTVRCRRVHHGTLTSDPVMPSTAKHQRDPAAGDEYGEPPIEQTRPTALPRAMVIDLLDCLGDDIARVHDAFMAHAEGESPPRLTLLSVCHTLDQLCLKQWSQKGKRRENETENHVESLRCSMPKLRHLLTRMIKRRALSLVRLPERGDVACIGYTDFIACYVAFQSSVIAAPAPRSTRKMRRKSTDVPAFRAAFPEGAESTGDDEHGHAIAPQVSQRSDTEERGGSGRKTAGSQRSRPRMSTRHASSRKHSVPGSQDSSGTQSPALFMRESTTAARQHLASSASRTRPAKQSVGDASVGSSSQKLAQWRAPMRPGQSCAARDDPWQPYSSASGSNNNNNEDDDDFVIVEDQLRGRHLQEYMQSHQALPPHTTKAEQNPTRRSRFVQPSSSRFPAELEPFIGDPEESDDPNLVGPLQFDRPPSRQRHAFPTNLLDPHQQSIPTIQEHSNNQNTHQWFHAPPQVDGLISSMSRFEAMDAETAIANTPLFESDDLMAITQLSDLRLDDFLGDVVAPIAHSVALGQSKPPSSSSALKTSLGEDFLSLFAQH
ncbi:hypothetical protein ATCC90586_000639 [Pythium insidiosum]|nr:hypothetical protein ATCC90586_000639 [Pythium insidiosum]